MKALNIIKNIIYAVVIAIVGMIAVLLVLSSDRSPVDLRSFTVLSGSMEPSIKMGGVVFVRPQGQYNVGDVVTYAFSQEKITVTHRVHEVSQEDGKLFFITKGDANEDPDPDPVTPGQIMGKVVFSIPLLGYLVNFARTQLGFIVLIVVPSVIIIYSELLNIKDELARKLKKQ